MFPKQALVALTFLCISEMLFSNAFERCELKFKGQPIPVDAEDPIECQSLDDLEKKAWEKENDYFDEFLAKMEDIEVHVTVVNGSIVLDTSSTTLQPIEEELTVNHEFRTIFYGRLNIFNKMDKCGKAEDTLQHCACLMDVRSEMIECLKDLETCFINNPPDVIE